MVDAGPRHHRPVFDRRFRKQSWPVYDHFISDLWSDIQVRLVHNIWALEAGHVVHHKVSSVSKSEVSALFSMRVAEHPNIHMQRFTTFIIIMIFIACSHRAHLEQLFGNQEHFHWKIGSFRHMWTQQSYSDVGQNKWTKSRLKGWSCF